VHRFGVPLGRHDEFNKLATGEMVLNALLPPRLGSNPYGELALDDDVALGLRVHVAGRQSGSVG
jgi:hypothetical protein